MIFAGIVLIAGVLWYAIRPGGANSPKENEFAGLVDAGQYEFLGDPEVELPPDVEVSLRRVVGPGALRVDSAHFARTSSGGIWIVMGEASGESVACLVQAGQGAASCSPLAEAARNGLSLGIVEPAKDPGKPPRGFLVLGVAPDWVKLAQLRVGVGKDATVRTVPVRGNAYALRAKAPILVEGFCGLNRRSCRHLTPVDPRSG